MNKKISYGFLYPIKAKKIINWCLATYFLLLKPFDQGKSRAQSGSSHYLYRAMSSLINSRGDISDNFFEDARLRVEECRDRERLILYWIIV